MTTRGATGNIVRRHGRALCADLQQRFGVLLSDAAVAASAISTACWGGDADLRVIPAVVSANQQKAMTLKTGVFSVRVDGQGDVRLRERRERRLRACWSTRRARRRLGACSWVVVMVTMEAAATDSHLIRCSQ